MSATTGPGRGLGYDRVLVDPPCTDVGALASRPHNEEVLADRDRSAAFFVAPLRRREER